MDINPAREGPRPSALSHRRNHDTTRAQDGRRAPRALGRRLAAGNVVAASLVVVVAVVAVGLALGACGKSENPTILNTEKVERAIEKSSLVQRGKRPRVSCPSGVHQKKGLTFACTAVVGRASTRFVVTQTNGSGNVRYEAR